jgi:DMSO reductase anchor subunit
MLTLAQMAVGLFIVLAFGTGKLTTPGCPFAGRFRQHFVEFALMNPRLWR